MLVNAGGPARRGRTVALFSVVGGGLVALGTTLLLENVSLVWPFLVMAGLLAVLPSFVVKHVEGYWLCLFLFTYYGFHHAPLELLVPQLRLSDLPFLVLLGLWAWKLSRHERSFRFPRHAWLGAAYLVWAGLSALTSESPYLGFVDWLRQGKFFLVYLFAVNNFEISWAKLGAIVLLGAILIQGSLTLARFTLNFGYVGGQAFGRTQRPDDVHLTISSADASSGGRRRSFGTVLSPRGTAGYLLILLPVPLLLATRTSDRRFRLALLAIAGLGVVALLSTFSRSGLLALFVEFPLWIWIAWRWGVISTRAVQRLVMGLALGVLLLAPMVYWLMAARPENVSARFSQYKAALNMIVANPVLGVGLNNSTLVQERYSPWSSGLSLMDLSKASTRHPIHSQHLVTVAEIGVVGAALYFGFFAVVLIWAARLALGPDRQLSSLCAAVLIGIAGLFAQAATDPIYESQLMTMAWLYAGIVVAIHDGASNVRRSPS
jgi:O-antigen ligase